MIRDHSVDSETSHRRAVHSDLLHSFWAKQAVAATLHSATVEALRNLRGAGGWDEGGAAGSK